MVLSFEEGPVIFVDEFGMAVGRVRDACAVLGRRGLARLVSSSRSMGWCVSSPAGVLDTMRAWLLDENRRTRSLPRSVLAGRVG